MFFKIENFKKNLNFEVTSNIKYVLKTGNPKESAGKDRMTFSNIVTCPEPSIGHRINLVDSYIMGFKAKYSSFGQLYLTDR